MFICHPDFANLAPINVYHKEMDPTPVPKVPEQYQNRHILFRKKISLTGTENAILKITADDYYKLYINGQFVTQGPAASYPNAYYYNELDVSKYLQKGENTFAVHTYYQGLINRVWVSSDQKQCLYFDLSIAGQTVLTSDESWLCTDHTGYTSLGTTGYETQFLECYNSNAPAVGFEQPGFDDSNWMQAAVLTNADYHLIKQPTKQLSFETVSSKNIETIPGGLRIDMGFEAVAYLNLTANGNQGDIITIRCGEELNEDGSVRYEMRCNCCYEEQWILSGRTDTLNQFDYKAFRYVELLFSQDIQIQDIHFTLRYYPYSKDEITHRLNTLYPNNEALRPILNLCADTILYGMQENFVDCPTREKGQYLGDVSIAARSHAVLTGDTTMMKKAICDFFASSFICPGLMAVSGASLMQEIADYSLQLPAQICWLYSQDHDVHFLRYAEPYLTGLYHYFLKYETPEGLLEGVTEKWNLVDWPENLRDGYDFPVTRPIGPGLHNVLNAFWCGFLESMDEFYSLLGMPPTGRTAGAKRAFACAFYSTERGLFCDSPALTHSAIHSNVLPLLFNIGTEDEALRRRLIDYIASRGLSSMGVYMAYFTLAALMQHGESELALKLTLDPGCWLNMLAEGATTTYEAWGKDQKWNTSLFHPWATAPLIVFAKGVRPY